MPYQHPSIQRSDIRSMETKEIYAETVRHFLEPVLPLLDDPSVTEILINGHKTDLFRARRPAESLGACSSPAPPC